MAQPHKSISWAGHAIARPTIFFILFQKFIQIF